MFHISLPVVIGTAAVTSAIFFVIVGFALRAQKVPILTGHQSLIGKVGVVKADLTPNGDILLTAEHWSAVSKDGQLIEVGTKVRVVAVDGLRLIVERD